MFVARSRAARAALAAVTVVLAACGGAGYTTPPFDGSATGNDSALPPTDGIVPDASVNDGGLDATVTDDAAPSSDAVVSPEASPDAGPEAAAPCATGTRCGALCVDTQSDPGNCGVCGRACTAIAGVPVCSAGTCGLRCNAGRGNCNATLADGCEVDLTADPANCGGCGVACGTREVCNRGQCVAQCNYPLLTCGRACADLQTAVSNCGACAHACPAAANASPSCTAGACGLACARGFADCNGAAADGCEVTLATDAANCGACGTSCGSGTCVAGVCSGMTCADRCTADGARRCLDDGTEQTCVRGSNGCLDWTTASCSPGQVCGSDHCETPVCAPACPAGLQCRATNACGGDLRNIVLDQRGFTVSGRLTVNGTQPTRNTSWCSSNGNAQIVSVRFVDAERGYDAFASVFCSSAADYPFSINLPAGNYRVTVSQGGAHGSAGGNFLPVPYLVNPRLAVSTNISGLLFDERGYAVSGRLTVNGMQPSRSSSYCGTSTNYSDEIVRVRFQDVAQGYDATTSLRCSGAAAYPFSISLPAGTYKVTVSQGQYHASAGGNFLPVAYIANPALVVSTSIAGLVLDERGFAVSGRLTVNGTTPSRSTSYCGNSSNWNAEVVRVRFKDEAQGYDTSVSLTCSGAADFPFSTVLPAGTYRVTVEQGSSHASAGSNFLPVAYVANSALTVATTIAGLVFDERGFAVSGRLTVNGATPSRSSSYCGNSTNYGDELVRVRFLDAAQGYDATTSLRCSSPSDYAFTTALPAGTYRVTVQQGQYHASAGGNFLPVVYVANGSLVVSTAVSGLVLNEQGYTVSGRLTVNGVQPTRNTSFCSSNYGAEIVRVRFRDETQGYEASASVTCASAMDDPFAITLPAGAYRVTVEQGGSHASAGGNFLPVAYVANPRLVVAGPVTGQVFDQQGFLVQGHLTVNGMQPTRSASYCGNSTNYNDEIVRVRFQDDAQRYDASVSVRCASAADYPYAVWLPAGVYRVSVQQGQYHTSAGGNFLPVTYVVAAGLSVP